MTLSPVQAAHRAAHRARLEIEARRGANSTADIERLLAWRAEWRATLAAKRMAITTLEDEIFNRAIQIVHIHRRLLELGYTGQ